MTAIDTRVKLYSLRIIPPKPIYSDVSSFKRQFEEVFGKQKYSGSKPHIALANFAMEYRWQTKVIETFAPLSNLSGFELEIQGFSTFPSNTLLLKVGVTEPLQRIHEKTEGLYNENFDPDKWPLIMSHPPHITISKTIGKDMLRKSLVLFEKMYYTHSFAVDRLTLVARESYGPWDWDHDIKLD